MVRFPSDVDRCEQLLAPDGSYDEAAVKALDLPADRPLVQ